MQTAAILLLLLSNLQSSTSGEYWYFNKDKSEHYETTGNITYSKNKFNFMLDFIIQQDIQNTASLFVIRPSFQYTGHLISFKVGNYKKVMGNGLILNETDNSAFKRYDYLQGGEFSLHALKFISISAFSAIPFNIDFNGRDYYYKNDTTDILRGMSTSISLPARINGEFAYVRNNTRQMPSTKSFSEIFGTTLSLNTSLLSVSTSLTKRLGVNPVLYKRSKGNGAYASLRFGSGEEALLLQYSYYDSINFFGYNLPPTPLHKELLITNANNEQGGSITLYLSPSSMFSTETGLGRMNNIKATTSDEKSFLELYQIIDYSSKNGNSYIHTKIGMEKGMRIEPEYTNLIDKYIQTTISITAPLQMDIDATGHLFNQDESPYKLGEFGLTYYANEHFNISAEFEKCTKKIGRFNFEDTWPSVLFTYRWNGSQIQLFYGRQRGGLTCSGGTCRIEPSFEGMKLLIQKSF